jgi:uncharacterized protein YkwD
MMACFVVACLACTYNARRNTPVEQGPMRVLASELRFGRQQDTFVSGSKSGEVVEVADLPASLLANYLLPALAAIGKGVSAVTTVQVGNNTELQMFQMLNNDRTAPAQAAEAGIGAQPLKWDPKLAAFARAHSQELADSGSFRHASADGTQPSVRLSRAGIQWVSMGENIATAQSVPRAEAALMNEPKFQENHRANILSRTFTNVGIGIASGPDGTLYITQDFVQPR